MLLNLTVLGREATTPAAKKTFRGQIISPKEGGGKGVLTYSLSRD